MCVFEFIHQAYVHLLHNSLSLDKQYDPAEMYCHQPEENALINKVAQFRKMHCYSSFFALLLRSIGVRKYGYRFISYSLQNEYKIQNWEQWWRIGESTRLPPMWPGFDSWIGRHMWVEFVGSLLYSAPRGFSPGTPVFPSHQKPTFDLI